MRSRSTIPIAAAVLIGLPALIAFVGLRYYLSHRDLRFDRATWIKPVGYCTKSPRGRMVDGLLVGYLKAGMPMSRVRHLLGPPDEIGNRYWLYNVSAEDEVFLDTCVTLELQTGDGRLQHVSLGRDS